MLPETKYLILAQEIAGERAVALSYLRELISLIEADGSADLRAVAAHARQAIEHSDARLAAAREAACR